MADPRNPDCAAGTGTARAGGAALGNPVLVGEFCLVMMAGYDYAGHASFHAYGCGVMAHPRAPDCVRDDVDLQAEFPAKELPGLSGRLIWYGESLPAQVRVELLDR